MYFADFETTTGAISKTSSSIYVWGVKGTMTGDKMEWGLDLAGFYKYIFNNKITPIYFHNVKFDFNFIFKDLLKLGVKFVDTMENKDYTLQNNEWTWLCDERGNIYSAEVCMFHQNVQFFDSWKVLMAPVEALGKTLGMKKLNEDYDYDEYTNFETKADVPKKVVKYLERDIDIVIETFTKAINIYDKQITRASMAYNDFQEMYGKREFALDFGGKVWNYREKAWEMRNSLSVDEWEICNKSYQGGYTNWNKKYTNKGLDAPNGIGVDVNSLYPSVMKNEKYPYGRALYKAPIDSEYVELWVIQINYAKKKKKEYPNLIKKRGGKYRDAKYLSKLKYEERVYWREELEYLQLYYDIDYYVVKKLYFRTKFVFKDWLEEKQWLKINAKDPVERAFHKGVYNSLYGKFGQNRKMGTRVIIKDGKTIKEIEDVKYLIEEGRKYDWVTTGTIKKKRVLRYENGDIVSKLTNKVRYGKEGEFRHTAKYATSEFYKHMAVASFTTMKARLVLFKAIMANLDLWVYSDTDSCYFLDYPTGIEIHPSKLGAWKTETKFNWIKVLRAKTYMYFETHEWEGEDWVEVNHLKQKVAGVSKEGKTRITRDNFHLGAVIKNGRKGSKNVDGGIIIVEQDFTLGKEVD